MVQCLYLLIGQQYLSSTTVKGPGGQLSSSSCNSCTWTSPSGHTPTFSESESSVAVKLSVEAYVENMDVLRYCCSQNSEQTAQGIKIIIM